MNRVLIHMRILPEYRVSVYEEIIRSNNNTFICFGNAKFNSSLQNGNVPKDGHFIRLKNHYLAIGKDVFFTNIIKIIKKLRPDVVVVELSLSNLIIWPLLIFRRLFRYKVIGWNQGWDRSRPDDNVYSLRSLLRNTLIQNVDGLLVYSRDSLDKIPEKFNREKFFVANNTLDTKDLLAHRDNLKRLSRKELKSGLGFTTTYNLIFVARIEEPKKPLRMIRFFEELKKLNDEVSLHIVGDGTLYETVRKEIESKVISGVHMYGAIYDKERIGEMIYCSDLLVIPAWVGLSILHGFSYECPILTFEEKMHPPEIMYLREGQTGFNLWKETFSEAALKINEYLLSENDQIIMKRNIAKMLEEEASISNYVTNFNRAVKYVRSK